ncbi:hypothetical protein N0V82_003421 [Gnomoniopsis sp. IMI 355080]|nr:hypothetical protein N0V82_003421 [Gnomoniopsis sp. IMI 355080]
MILEVARSSFIDDEVNNLFQTLNPSNKSSNDLPSFFFFLSLFYILDGQQRPRPSPARKHPERYRSWVIVHQLDILQDETQQLNAMLATWNKDLMGSLDVSDQTAQVLQVTKNATITIITESRKLRWFGALHVKKHTKHLINDIKVTVDHLKSFKEDFNKIGIAQDVLDGLTKQQAASKEMNDAIVAKLPAAVRGAGRHLGRKISKIFQKTIDEYTQMLAANPEPALHAGEK